VALPGLDLPAEQFRHVLAEEKIRVPPKCQKA